MTTTQIRQQLHNYIDAAEDKKLKAIYTLLEDDIDVDAGYKLSREQKAELDRRYDDYQKGIGKTYTWDEAVSMTEQALADRKK
jgi:putative addiction module component (TIGR02574 family)